MEEQTKNCKQCGISKTLDQFHKHPTGAYGRTGSCKACRSKRNKSSRVRAYHRKYSRQNRDKLRKYAMQWYRDNPEKALYSNAKRRAKQKGIQFALDIEDIQIPEFCPVLGIPIEIAPSGSKCHIDTSPSLDRIDNSIGYVKGNVIVVSWRANNLKKDATIEELEQILAFYKSRIVR